MGGVIGYGGVSGALTGGQSQGKGPVGTVWRVRGLQGRVVECPGGGVGREEGREEFAGGEVIPAAAKGPALGFERDESRDVPAQERPEQGLKFPSGHMWSRCRERERRARAEAGKVVPRQDDSVSMSNGERNVGEKI